MSNLLSSLWFRSRKTDPETSHIAAERIEEAAENHFNLIANALANGPLGKDGIAYITKLDPVQVARRLPEMQKSNIVRLTGCKVMSFKDRPEREWELVV